jgi:hypothetical protein
MHIELYLAQPHMPKYLSNKLKNNTIESEYYIRGKKITAN